MDPTASSFSFSGGAAEWSPGGAPADPQAAFRAKLGDTPPPPPAAPEPPAPAPEEKDKLWTRTMKIANGDRSDAKRLLQNPDELLQHDTIWKHMDLEDLKALEAEQQASPVVEEPEEEVVEKEEIVEIQEAVSTGGTPTLTPTLTLTLALTRYRRRCARGAVRGRVS